MLIGEDMTIGADEEPGPGALLAFSRKERLFGRADPPLDPLKPRNLDTLRFFCTDNLAFTLPGRNPANMVAGYIKAPDR